MKNYCINCKGNVIDFSVPKVMGIVNVTPDSFFAGSRCETEKDILERTERHLSEGAEFIDLGACSTRPGYTEIPENEEIKRLDFALKLITDKFPDVVISVDTYRSNVAEFAAKNYGISIINDISGGLSDERIFSVASKYSTCYVLTHNTEEDMMQFFVRQTDKLKQLGVKDIILDPGFGFAKTLDGNYDVLRDMEKLQIFEMPLLVGISRKSMIFKLLNITPMESLNGTSVLNTISLNKGADILRVHDVKEAVETVKICQKAGFIR